MASGGGPWGGWPEWWNWNLELTSHLRKRMVDRRFTEIELREMLRRASMCYPDFMKGRWVIASRHGGRRWEVIVEPDETRKALVVITAYPVSRRRG